jgi:hypothetical protein
MNLPAGATLIEEDNEIRLPEGAELIQDEPVKSTGPVIKQGQEISTLDRLFSLFEDKEQEGEN